MGGSKDGRSGKPSTNGRRAPAVTQRSRALSPATGHSRGTTPSPSKLQQPTSTVSRKSVTGCDHRGRPPRPPSPLIAAGRPMVATLSRTDRGDRGLTPMGERNRSNSLPSRHGDLQKLPPGKLKPYSSLTDRPTDRPRGSHLDEGGLEKARQAAQSRVDAYVRHKQQHEARVTLRDPALRQAQATARKQLYSRRQRQRAVTHALNQLLQMSEECKAVETAGSGCSEVIHTNRAV